MPKIKTNRTAYAKFRVGGTGRLKRAQAFTSHNTAKKSRSRIRRLRKQTDVDLTNAEQVKSLLPYS